MEAMAQLPSEDKHNTDEKMWFFIAMLNSYAKFNQRVI